MKKGKVDLISSGIGVGRSLISEESEQSEKLFEAIKILMRFGEKDLAFQLRVAHDNHLRLNWKERT